MITNGTSYIEGQQHMLGSVNGVGMQSWVRSIRYLCLYLKPETAH